MDPHQDNGFNWQTWVLAAMTAAIFGISIGMASARPQPKLPTCNASETRQHIMASFAEDIDITVFGLHSLRESYSIDEGRSLRHCTAIAVTGRGNRIITFVIGWEDPAKQIAYWSGRGAE